MERNDSRDLLADLIARARKAGADEADAILVESASLSLARRLDRPEKLERSESVDLGLRVLVGKRQAIVSSTDLAAATQEAMIERAVAMARAVPEDPHCGLAAPDELQRDVPDLDLLDPREPDSSVLEARARAAEDAARAVPGITNSEGAEAGWGRARVTLAASNGFSGSYAGSQHSVGVSVIAGTGTAMESDHDHTSVRHAGDLEDPAIVGTRAGERAVRRLNPRKPATAKVPVVFDPRAARGLVGHLAGAINGQAIARGTSFLKDKMGSRVFAAGIDIIDDPHRRRGLASKPYDGEGCRNQARALVEDGVLKSWVLDQRSARKLGLRSTGHASRGTGGPPSPATTNLHLTAGSMSRQALLADIKEGLYVMQAVGQGVNTVTGDYSRGATGFWIVNGELAYPVSEITIAGNLEAMFRELTAADDLEFRYAVNAPTCRIDGMTVAGV